MASTQQQSRLLSTSARVHPPYLPHLYTAATKPSPLARGIKWVPPLAGALAAGYVAVSTYRTSAAAAQQRQAEAEQADLERRRQNAALADAYGDRSSLEELERAMRVYEAQRSNN
ncbi:hypothetical protein QC763_607010 [Podospora pseudopauciseta]|uniref:Uncharacterized protein n=1 Tax=Podospora pseudopauciseta TaxID=2093780 RepID=A0ABR0H5C9_9PEZI|nr:hypothetical protein QC763_607010 [Podospora pseudopauciseta]